MNVDMDMLFNRNCCRYLFSCEKKEKKHEIELVLAAAFTLYINVFFLFFLLLLHKNMTRWLDPTRTFFLGGVIARGRSYT